MRPIDFPEYPNATETMAERAWRYGEAGLPHKKSQGTRAFADGSMLYFNRVYTARTLRHLLDRVDGEYPDWSAA